MRTLAAAAVILGATAMLVGCAANPLGMTRLPPPFDEKGVHVVLEEVFYEGSGVRGVSGVARNTTAREMGTVVLSLDAVDAEGSKIAEAVASKHGLSPGEPWRFTADFVRPIAARPMSVRLRSLRVYF
ncbi:MAG: FxLYD domain-containing protein [Pseudomonadota bacterium]